ncbi:MAG: hypothetical protein H6737_31935 [Alphaproteobacteria bacterium]|nr:hypothetical protein [Alphaproteobacteria bacterium]
MTATDYIRSIQCQSGVAYLHRDGYVVMDQVPRATQTWETACELMRAGVQLSEPGKRAAVVVLANESRTDRGARRAFQEVGAELLGCVALVVRSKVSEVTGNFFLRINNPPYPMRLFGDPAEASSWVKEHIGQPLGPGAEAILRGDAP